MGIPGFPTRESILAETKTGKVVDGYMPKEELMTYLQAGVDQMIATGQMPAGSVVMDVRATDVVFLVKKPDGSVKQIAAMLVPERILDEAVSVFSAPDSTQ